MDQKMHCIVTTRAQIALDHLPPDERKKAARFLSALSAAGRLLELGDKVYKLHSVAGSDIFVGRIGTRYRAILRQTAGSIEILEIVDHDRLQRTYGLGGGMR
ncbi:MAG: hypothetical protein HYV96_07045 [Opitutae bacterium]|nr:hypothetical protein [Opitutae bacterium]